MCVGGKEGGGSPIKGAGATAWTNFAIGAIGGFQKHRNEVKEVNDINRERLARNERNRWLYHTDYRDRVVGWKSAIVDKEIVVDETYQDALNKLADSQLKVWQSIKEGSIAEQEAFAAMMSVGSGSGQTGARSSTTTNRREAVIKYGNKIAQISAARGSGRDSARLYADMVRTKFANQVHGADIKIGESRPVYGAPPARVFLKSQPSMWNPILDIASSGLKAMMQYDSLTPDDRSSNVPDIPEDDFSPDDYPDWQPGEWTTDDPISGVAIPEGPSNAFSINSPSLRSALGLDSILTDAPARGQRAADRLLGKRQQNTFGIG
tara:strand:+ start:5564 stop:6526 length:963 start_codon:yes stop_codon:yes gene_type:complete